MRGDSSVPYIHNIQKMTRRGNLEILDEKLLTVSFRAIRQADLWDMPSMTLFRHLYEPATQHYSLHSFEYTYPIYPIYCGFTSWSPPWFRFSSTTWISLRKHEANATVRQTGSLFHSLQRQSLNLNLKKYLSMHAILLAWEIPLKSVKLVAQVKSHHAVWQQQTVLLLHLAF